MPRCRSCSRGTAWVATSRWRGPRSTRTGSPGWRCWGRPRCRPVPGRRSTGRSRGSSPGSGSTGCRGPWTGSSTRCCPDELAAVIKEAGYGFDGIPAAWAGVMGLCRPEMLAEVTAPVLLAQRPARPAADRRAPVRAGGPVGPLGPRGHRAAGAARVPPDPPERDRGRAVGAAQRSACSGGIMTAPPTGGTCADGVAPVGEHLDEPVTGVGGPLQLRRRPARGVQGAVVDRHDVPGPGARAGVGGLDRAHVPGGQPRAPPADGQQGEVDRGAGELGEQRHVRVQRGVAGEPHHDATAAQQHPGGAVGAVRHRPGLVVGPHEQHLHAGAGGCQVSADASAGTRSCLSSHGRLAGWVTTGTWPTRRSEGRSAWSWCRWLSSTTSTSSTWCCTGRSRRRRSGPRRRRRRGSVRTRRPPSSSSTVE